MYEPVIFFAVMTIPAFGIATVWQLFAPDSRRVRIILGSAGIWPSLLALPALMGGEQSLLYTVLTLLLFLLFSFAVALVGAGPGAILGGYLRRRIRTARKSASGDAGAA